jgi:ribosomal protein L29
MKRKDLDQLKEKDTKALADKLQELANSLTLARLEREMQTVKNTNITKHIRKDIAQIKTILHEKKLLEEISK